MMLTPDISPADWLSLGPRFVGVTFIWTAVIKAIAPQTFSQHLYRLGWIPRELVPATVTAAAGLEAGLGVALVLFLAPGVILPATLALLALLSAIAWWGVRSGKTSDCGCYGGFIQPSIGQSVALNATFATLVALPWLNGGRSTSAPLWQLLLVASAAALVAIFTEVSQQWPRRKGKPLIDLDPLKVGRPWRHRWAGNSTAGMKGEFLVAYLGPNCPYCVQFVRIANAMIQSPALPRVVGVVSTSKNDLDAFVQERKIRFPVTAVSQSLMARLAQGVPTVALVEDGIIRAHWSGDMPAEMAQRFTLAFFPQTARQSGAREGDFGVAAEKAG